VNGSRWIDEAREESKSNLAVCRLSFCLHNQSSRNPTSMIPRNQDGQPYASHDTMSLLRPSIAGRLLRASGPAARKSMPTFVRHDSQTSSGTPLTQSDKSQPAYQSGESSMVNHPGAGDKQVRHNQPDYDAEVDQASSLAFPTTPLSSSV
jgi:hypothetical protein